MSVIELHCPHCSARLRMRDLSFVGRTVDCPDCRRAVAIVRMGAGSVEAIPGEESKEPVVTARQGLLARRVAATSEGTPAANDVRLRKSGGHPAWLPWGLGAALVVVLTVIGFLLWSERQALLDPVESVARVEEPMPPDVVDPPTPAPPKAVNDRQASDDPRTTELKSRMQTLGEWVRAYHARHGVYPTPNPLASPVAGDRRLGWLADLAADQSPNGAEPLWDRPFDDPLNARFVRRRMPVFLNPYLDQQEGAEGHPASHFAGMGGVGADAPWLPVTDPRAGVFGWERATRMEDIRDGASNVMMIVGVESGFRPWGAGGAGTIRSLTAEPYFSGPDGLGTGQPDGMHVLMADGSVKFLSQEISPTVMRRMAAMGDGWPLDAGVVGEPGEPLPAAPPVTPPPPGIAAGPAAGQPAGGPEPPVLDDRPIEAPLARDLPRPPQYNVERALNQPIVRFAQTRPVKVVDLLGQMEELAGIPVRVASQPPAVDAAILEQSVSLELSDTTVRQVLDELTRKAGLRYETGREFGIRILPAGEDSGSVHDAAPDTP